MGAQRPDGMYFQRTESWSEVGAEGSGKRGSVSSRRLAKRDQRTGASRTIRFRVQPKNFGLLCGSDDKESTCNVGDPGSIPG